MNYNYHTHTFRCHHATGTEREYIEEAIKKVSGRYDKIFNPDVESKQHKEAWVAYWQAKNKRRALESSNADPEEIRRLLRQENRLRKHLEISKILWYNS